MKTVVQLVEHRHVEDEWLKGKMAFLLKGNVIKYAKPPWQTNSKNK